MIKTIIGIIVGIIIGVAMTLAIQFYAGSKNEESTPINASNNVQNIAEENILSQENLEEKKTEIKNEDDSDFVVLYDGLPIQKVVGMQELEATDGIDKADLDIYDTTYYSYHPDGYMKIITEPKFVDSMFAGNENIVNIENLSRISVSKEYDVIPRTIDYYPEYYDAEKDSYFEYYNNIEEYYKDRDLIGIKNPPNIARIDLNGDGNYIYVVLTAERIDVVFDEEVEKYPGTAINYDAFDKNGKHICSLMSKVFSRSYLNLDDFELDSLADSDVLTAADIDNDSNMELIIESGGYEFSSNIYIYKYENGEIKGEINAKQYIAP